MSKDTQRIVNLLMVLIPLSSLPFLGIKNIKRFLPASLLVLLMGSIDVQIGKKRKWWTFYNKPNAYFSNEFPFHIGPFLVGSLWILKWAYGNWGKFLLLNAIIDAIFAGPLTTISQKAKLFRTVWLNRTQFFFYFFYKAFFLYLFQYLFESKSNNVN